jgi:hypothetical protein
VFSSTDRRSDRMDLLAIYRIQNKAGVSGYSFRSSGDGAEPAGWAWVPHGSRFIGSVEQTTEMILFAGSAIAAYPHELLYISDATWAVPLKGTSHDDLTVWI